MSRAEVPKLSQLKLLQSLLRNIDSMPSVLSYQGFYLSMFSLCNIPASEKDSSVETNHIVPRPLLATETQPITEVVGQNADHDDARLDPLEYKGYSTIANLMYFQVMTALCGGHYTTRTT